MQDILMVGYVAQGITGEIARDKREELVARYSAGYIDRMQKEEVFIETFPSEEAVSLEEQGVFAGLWELGERFRTGLKVQLTEIPIRQETVELANFLDINPYELPCKGSWLLLADNGRHKVEELQQAGYAATVIGRTDAAKARLVIHGEEQRFLTPTR